MDINRVILSNLGNPEQLFHLLNDNLNDERLLKSILYRSIHKLLEFNNDNTIVILNKLHNNDYTLKALQIRAYSNSRENLENAINIIDVLSEKFKKKRMYIPILKGLIKWYPKKAFNFLVKISKMFRLFYEDIKDFFTNSGEFNIDYDILFDIVSKNEIILRQIDLNKEISDYSQFLGKITITTENREQLISNFKTEYLGNKKQPSITAFNKIYKKYNIFIDGNNILFHYKRKVDFSSFLRLGKVYYELIEQGYKPLIIIHKRHRDYLKTNFPKEHIEIKKILNKLDIYYTPYKMNDDLFFIWGSLNNVGSYILSNDKLKDHIFKITEENLVSNTLSKWIRNTVITFKTNETQSNISVKFSFPEEVSYCAQKNGDRWYIPVGNNEWICY